MSGRMPVSRMYTLRVELLSQPLPLVRRSMHGERKPLMIQSLASHGSQFGKIGAILS